MGIPAKRIKVQLDLSLFSPAMCLLWGALCAILMHHWLAPSSIPDLPKLKPVVISVAGVKDAKPLPNATGTKPVSGSKNITEASSKKSMKAAAKSVLPLKSTTVETPKPVTTSTDLSPILEKDDQSEVEKLITHLQDKPTPNTPEVLPTIQTEGVPPAPGEEKPTYTEIPGGSVLVLEVVLNDQGQVLESKIAVPTFKPLSDVAIAWAIRAQNWKNVDPPLQIGEIRKIVLRFPYADEEAKNYPEVP